MAINNDDHDSHTHAGSCFVCEGETRRSNDVEAPTSTKRRIFLKGAVAAPILASPLAALAQGQSSNAQAVGRQETRGVADSKSRRVLLLSMPAGLLWRNTESPNLSAMYRSWSGTDLLKRSEKGTSLASGSLTHAASWLFPGSFQGIHMPAARRLHGASLRLVDLSRARLSWWKN